MPTTTYTIVHSEILSENRSGTERAYLSDVIGSTMALADSSQAVTDTFSYWPFGEQKSHSGPSQTPLRFLGVYGARRDSATRTHIGARELKTSLARWSQQDRLWMDRTRYSYSLDNPINYRDSDGYQAELAPKPPPPLYLVEGGGLGFWGTRVGAIPVIGGMIIGGVGGAYFGDWADRASNGGWSRFWGNVMAPGFGDLIDPNREWELPADPPICAPRNVRKPSNNLAEGFYDPVGPSMPDLANPGRRRHCPPCPPDIEEHNVGDHTARWIGTSTKGCCFGHHTHILYYVQNIFTCRCDLKRKAGRCLGMFTPGRNCQGDPVH